MINTNQSQTGATGTPSIFKEGSKSYAKACEKAWRRHCARVIRRRLAEAIEGKKESLAKEIFDEVVKRFI